MAGVAATFEAQDVTKQYVDLSSRLRNFRAQEAQYLGILKQARTVKDTVVVSDKLNEVRGQIEQQQAEFDALAKQVETVALTIELHAEVEAQVFGLHWRLLYQLKLAARDGIDGIGDYAAAMASFCFLHSGGSFVADHDPDWRWARLAHLAFSLAEVVR